MANYMAEVAKLLGVELGEEFQIYGNGEATVKLTKDGLEIVTILGKLKEYATEMCLARILAGKYIIKRKPWKPKLDEWFWCVQPNGEYALVKWLNEHTDLTLYKIGNCYKAKEEAIANYGKWVSFYASDEVLEV